jgi:hypothetical protein
MTDVTKEDLEAGFTALSQSLTAEIGKLPALFAEALKVQAPASTEGTSVAGTEGTPSSEVVIDTTDSVSEPVIDHAAIIEALRTNDLPAVSASAVIADIKAGKTIAEAVDSQVKLREAYAASVSEGGVVRLKESDGGNVTGLARAVTVL